MFVNAASCTTAHVPGQGSLPAAADFLVRMSAILCEDKAATSVDASELPAH